MSDSPSSPAPDSEWDQLLSLLKRAEALIQIRRDREALPLLYEALRIAPPDSCIHCFIACARLNLREYAECLKEAEKAIALDPEYEWGHRLRAWALLDSGRVEEGLEAALSAARCEPDRLEAMAVVVHGASRNGRGDLAREWAERAREHHPDTATAHILLGSAAMGEGSLAEAEQHFRRALEVEPASWSAMHNLGAVLDAQGRHAEAADYLYQAARLDPEQDSSPGRLFAILAAYTAKGLGTRLLVVLAAAAVVWPLCLVLHLNVVATCGIIAAACALGYLLWGRYRLARLPAEMQRFYVAYRPRYRKIARPTASRFLAALWQSRSDLGGALQAWGVLAGAWGGCAALVVLPIVWLAAGRGDCLTYLVVLGITIGSWIRMGRIASDEEEAANVDPPAPQAPCPPDPVVSVPDPLLPPPPIVPVGRLAFQPAATVDAALGRPQRVELVDGAPGRMPGEIRGYELADGSAVSVRFVNGRAISFRLELPPEAGACEAAEAVFGALGIDVREMLTEKITPAAQVWYGRIGNLALRRVRAARNADGAAMGVSPGMPFRFVEAELQYGGVRG